MTESLFIFGNGLGMSIDPDYFSLESGLKRAWAGVDEAQRELICQSLGLKKEKKDSAPKSEGQLYNLQKISDACQLITRFESQSGKDWLTDDGKKFPNAIRQYIHSVALTYLQKLDLNVRKSPGEKFSGSLKNHISENGAHILTMNYDDLLYDLFADDPIMKKTTYCVTDFLQRGLIGRGVKIISIVT